jgi:hypothetical protein
MAVVDRTIQGTGHEPHKTLKAAFATFRTDPRQLPLPLPAPMNRMPFEGALLYLRSGGRVRRLDWRSAERIRLMVPDGSSISDPQPLNPPWIIMERGLLDPGFEPWAPTQRDLLAHDWVTLDQAGQE